MYHPKTKQQAQNLADYMTLSHGDKVLVVGTGATRNKVGYITDITACHYVLYFMDESSARVWKQNVRLLNSDNQSEKEKVEDSKAKARDRGEGFTETLQSQLTRALADQKQITKEIANLVRKLTGVSVEDSSPKRAHAKKG